MGFENSACPNPDGSNGFLFLTSFQKFSRAEGLDSNSVGNNFTRNESILTFRSAFKKSNVEASSAINLPNVEDMTYWIVVAVLLILARKFVETYFFKPVGLRLGIRPPSTKTFLGIPCRNPTAIPILESSYRSNSKKPSHSQIVNLQGSTNLEEREIERWFRRRRALDRASKLTKFTESGWRFVCYVCSTVLGTWTIWDKKWAWNYELLWDDYPNHDVSNDMWWYYLFGSGLYLSFLITQAFDVKRKDFWEMFLHHVVTITLLVSSWSLNFTRVGVLILLLHDCADVFLESSKMAIYAKKEGLFTGIFIIFTAIWIVTRLYIFPKKIIWGICARLTEFAPLYVAYAINGLLSVLFCLHVFWTYFICKLAMAAVNPAEKQKDARSSTEESSSESGCSFNEEDANDQKMETSRVKRKPRTSYHNLRSLSSNSILSRIDSSQRAIIKRISAEIT